MLSEFRLQRGLSLQRLAEISGVSKSMISQIENGLVNPTLAVVWKLSVGLGLRVQDLLEADQPHPDAQFRRLDESNCPVLSSTEQGYRMMILSTLDMVERVELYLIELQPKGEMDSDPHPSGTVETLTVISGAVEVELPEGETHRIEALQSARYRADVSHSIRGVSRKPSLFYLAVKFEWSE